MLAKELEKAAFPALGRSRELIPLAKMMEKRMVRSKIRKGLLRVTALALDEKSPTSQFGELATWLNRVTVNQGGCSGNPAWSF